jgi:tRNA threonylcarbamoyladenosine biosynthesis protein TsaE
MMQRLADEAATLDFGSRLFPLLQPGMLVFLRGDLGAGKTTLVRGCLRAAGHAGKVKSPTYTLVEEYRLEPFTLFHFDLYRIHDPEELEWMGIRDYLSAHSLCFVEWPERAGGLLPKPDLEIALSSDGDGRRLQLQAYGTRGERVSAALAAACESVGNTP